MTQEEKVALLKKAGVWDVIGFPSCIGKLFDLVAAHEREKLSKIVLDDTYAMTFQTLGQYRTALAAAIRARGDK